MLLELIVAAFITTYVLVVALGHYLLMAAIYQDPREHSSDGRGRRTAVGPRVAAATPANQTRERPWSRYDGEPIPQP